MTSSPGYEGERARKRGVKVFSLLSSEFQDNDWAVTVQRRSQPSETMTSASFSLFISLHFSPFSFFSYYTHTQKKKKNHIQTESALNLHGSPPFPLFFYFFAHSANTRAKTGICGWSFSSRSGEYFLRKRIGQQTFSAVVLNADLHKLSVQTIKALEK